ncbi:thiosulfate sulfurtransferase [Photobacterium jeanii]|uniref:Thiosulfate sulfurtransferase n=1 Tax=Photobacterium jeanii TaxID=858640 RepID=A0A178K7C1_9GAMM|nr:rhodanese-like domain-containing protein [Photobacterium jeanii]OAN13191.1 thiosulfate sulfurtransferase [Photobacterium jeanii]PST89342.1 sulfurtransferase [Photobacterium jeanii]
MNNITKVILPALALASAGSQAMTFNELSAKSQDEVQVIDCRSSNFFNGWPEHQAEKGGHFPGAINVDSGWLPLMENAQFSAIIKEKQLVKDKPTYLYCSKTAQQEMKGALEKQGFSDLHLMTQSLADYQGELTALPQFQQLVSPEWVKQVINGEPSLYSPKKGYRVVEVAYGPPIKYLASHIPGALYLNTNDIETKPLWNRVSPDKLKKVFSDLGISHDTTVILYGRDNMAAGRVANIMMYAGVEDVRLLNGGWKAWVNAGFITEPMLVKNTEKVEFGREIPANPQYLVDIEKARELLNGSQQTHSLVSIRSWEEFIGKVSGYNYIKPKGRITGAKWGHGGSDANSLEDFRNPDETMKSPDDIERFWHRWNIDRNQEVSFYCGTGWRASEVFFYTYVMGWKNISVYDGGWYEWSGDTINPTSTGEVERL